MQIFPFIHCIKLFIYVFIGLIYGQFRGWSLFISFNNCIIAIDSIALFLLLLLSSPNTNNIICSFFLILSLSLFLFTLIYNIIRIWLNLLIETYVLKTTDFYLIAIQMCLSHRAIEWNKKKWVHATKYIIM